MGELVAYARLDRSGFRRGVDESKGDMQGLQRDVNGRLHDIHGRYVAEGAAAGEGLGKGISKAGPHIDKLDEKLKSLGKGILKVGEYALKGGGLAVLGTAAAGAASQTLSLTAAILPAVGAVGLLPAAAVAGAGALGVLKLATSGFGKVMKAVGTEDATKFQEAIKELSPQARALAVELRSLRPAFEGLRDSVQDAVFRGMAGRVKALAATWLPILHDRLTGIGLAWNVAFRNFAVAARSRVVVQGISAALDSAHLFLARLNDQVGPLVKGLGALVGVAVPFIDNFGRGLATLAGRFGAFLQRAAQSGRLASFFQLATQTLEDLGGIVLQVGGILRSVLGAAAAGAGGLLNNLRMALGAVNRFLASTEGQTALRDFFTSTSGVLKALLPSLFILASAFGTVLAPAIATVAGVLAPVVGVLAGALVTAVTALAPVLPSLADSFGRIVVALAPVLPAVATLAAALVIALLPVVNALVPVIAGLVAVLTPVLRVLAPLAPVIVGIAAVIGALFIPMLISMGVAALASAASVAAAWVIAFAPLLPLILIIALVAAAVIGLTVLIVKNWDTIKRATLAAWNAARSFVIGAAQGIVNWFQSTWTRLGEIITGPIAGAVSAVGGFFAQIWRSVVSFFGGLPAFLAGVVTAVTGWLLQLPARAAYATGFIIGRFLRLLIELPDMISRLATASLAAFGRFVTGLITGAASLSARVGSVIAGMAARLPGQIARGTTAAAVAFGRWVADMVGRAVSFGTRSASAINSFANRLPGIIARGTAGALGAFGRWASSMIAAGGRMGRGVLSAIRNGIAGIPGLVSGIAGRVIAAFAGVARRAFDAARNLAQNLWNGFKSGLFGSPKTKIEYALLAMNAAVKRELGVFGAHQQNLAALSNFASRPLAIAGGGVAGTLARPTPVGAAGGTGAAGAAGGVVRLEIRSGGSRLDDLLVEVLRKSISAQGGDVQVVLGRRR